MTSMDALRAAATVDRADSDLLRQATTLISCSADRTETQALAHAFSHGVNLSGAFSATQGASMADIAIVLLVMAAGAARRAEMSPEDWRRLTRVMGEHGIDLAADLSGAH